MLGWIRFFFCPTVVLSLATLSCTPLHVEPMKTSVERHDVVRVVVQESPDEELRFQVLNLSDEPLIIAYDAISIESYFGTFDQPPSWADKVTTVPPRGVRTVSLGFSADGLSRGDELTVHFEGALLQDDRAIPIDPLGFMVTKEGKRLR